MYREDSKAEGNWGSIVERIAPRRPVVTEEAGYRQQMENEYVRTQLQEGGNYSLPRLRHQQDEDGTSRTVEEVTHFEVLQVQHGQHRTARTIYH